jgi:response regulator of citrate/malate metabolism
VRSGAGFEVNDFEVIFVAVRIGGFDYLLHPFDSEKFVVVKLVYNRDLHSGLGYNGLE